MHCRYPSLENLQDTFIYFISLVLYNNLISREGMNFYSHLIFKANKTSGLRHLAGITLSVNSWVRNGIHFFWHLVSFSLFYNSLEFPSHQASNSHQENHAFVVLFFSRDKSLLISRERLSLVSHSLFLEGKILTFTPYWWVTIMEGTP